MFRLTPRLTALLGLLFLAGFAALLFGSLFSGRRSIYFGDLGMYFIPQLAFERRELLVGRIPLWNPFVLCGTPFVGNPQTWPLYPSTLLLCWFPPNRVAGMVGAGHVLLGAVGTLLFLQRRGHSAAAATIGAIAWGFGGAVVSKMQFPNMVQAGAYLPWLLLALERLIERVSARRVGALATVVGLALLAAHAQMFWMQFYLSAAWLAWRMRPGSAAKRKGVLIAAVAALSLGAMLSAGQMLPVVEHAQASVRAALRLGQANRFYVPGVMAVSNFVAPNWFGNPASGNYDGRGNFWEPCCYIGLVPLLLALTTALLRFRRLPDVRFWTVAAALTLWLSLGASAGLYAGAFYVLPGLKKFHDPARFLYLATFALACLAATGADLWLQAVRRPLSRNALAIGLLALTVADLYPFISSLNPTVDARVFDAPRLLTLEPERGRLAHADTDRVWSRFATYRTYGQPENDADTDRVAAFLNCMGPNIGEYWGIRDAFGYEPVRREASGKLFKILVEQATVSASNGRHAPILRAAAVGTVVSIRPKPSRSVDLGPPHRRAFGAQAQSVLRPAPRAAVWPVWNERRTDDAIWRAMRMWSWTGTPLVQAERPLPDPFGPMRERAAVIRDVSPQHLEVDLPAGGATGLLVVRDTATPGWRAWIDGQRAPIITVDGVFRGVFVSSRARRVTFRYEPETWRLGVYISLVGVGILAGILGFQITARRVATEEPGFILEE